MHCRYSKLCNDLINSHKDLIWRRRQSISVVPKKSPSRTPSYLQHESLSHLHHTDVEWKQEELSRQEKDYSTNAFELSGPMCSMVQDNDRDPQITRIYNAMKEDERFIFKRSNKVQRSTLQALQLSHRGQMCLIDHTKQGGFIEYASMGFCDLIGRLPWEVHGNQLIHVLGISNIDEQDERYRVLCSRTHHPSFSSKAGAVMYPHYVQLMKNIEDFVSVLTEGTEIDPEDARALPMMAGIYQLHSSQRPITEVVVVMQEVYLVEPDYETHRSEVMHQYRRLLVIVCDIGNVVKEIQSSLDSIIVENSFTFEHQAVATHLHPTILKYTQEFHTTKQGLPRLYPLDHRKVGCLSERHGPVLPILNVRGSHDRLSEAGDENSSEKQPSTPSSVAPLSRFSSSENDSILHVPFRNQSSSEDGPFLCCRKLRKPPPKQDSGPRASKGWQVFDVVKRVYNRISQRTAYREWHLAANQESQQFRAESLGTEREDWGGKKVSGRQRPNKRASVVLA